MMEDIGEDSFDRDEDDEERMMAGSAMTAKTSGVGHQNNHGTGNGAAGFEGGFGDLRLASPNVASSSRGDSRSRSRVGGGGGRDDPPRGRLASSTSGSFRGRSQSTSKGRSSSRASVSAASSTASDAEVARLKKKVAELTFLNSLMQSRLAQLEGPGRVPLTPMSGLVATPMPTLPRDPDEVEEENDVDFEDDERGRERRRSGDGDEDGDEDDEMDAEGEEDDDYPVNLPQLSQGQGRGPFDEDALLGRYGVTAQDPNVRASLLSFFRSGQAGGAGVGA
ncbi:hypothetical protein T439DRAFT_320680 [Meredithblackwellia eburnea MCA 4105]